MHAPLYPFNPVDRQVHGPECKSCVWPMATGSKLQSQKHQHVADPFTGILCSHTVSYSAMQYLHGYGASFAKDASAELLPALHWQKSSPSANCTGKAWSDQFTRANASTQGMSPKEGLVMSLQQSCWPWRCVCPRVHIRFACLQGGQT